MSERPDRGNEWIRYSNLSESERLLVRKKSGSPRIVFSIALITLGVLLFLGNLGILPIREIWTFWPLFALAVGISNLVGGRNSGVRLRGVLMILFGSLFLLVNLGVLHIRTGDGSWLLSLILIAVGSLALVRVLDSSRVGIDRSTCAAKPFWGRPGGSSENFVTDVAVVGAVKRKLETGDFQGGHLTTILGSIEIDLRPARISSAERSAVLNVTAIFGAIKIRVPQEWRILLSGASVLGKFEDKTVPPNTGASAPALVITGWSIFGSVEIED